MLAEESSVALDTLWPALIDAVLRAPDFDTAATVLCSELVAATAADRVSVGWVRGGQCRLAAVSGGGSTRLPPEHQHLLLAAMNEAMDQGVAIDSARGATLDAVMRAAQALARIHGGRVLTVPMGHGGMAVGALTLEFAVHGTEGSPQATEAARSTQVTRAAQAAQAALWAERSASAAGPLLSLFDQARQSAWRRLLPMLRSQPAQAAASVTRRRRILWLAGAASLALVAMLVPLPHSISAQARVEGAVQRVIAAPANGYLQEVLVRPGDTVRAGQAIARLGERDLELERGRLSSDIVQRRSEKAIAMAKADRAAMMIAQSQIDEAQAQVALIDRQLERFVLASPIDGVLIDGDLLRAVGTPVERGQTLFTVAPGDRYRVIVELDERDIASVHVGQKGRLALSALPWDSIDLTVLRVAAMARSLDDRNVFELEAEPASPRSATADPGAGLRPGLRGVARLDAPAASLAEVWSRRIASRLRGVIWRWWP